MAKKVKEKKEVKITHYMADGTIRDSVEGYPVPVNETTKIAYKILADMAMKYYAAEEKGA